jgi:hypothetical protein
MTLASGGSLKVMDIRIGGENKMKEVVGHGGIAEALKETDRDFLFFASGVANSREDRESEYDRERELLLSQDRDRHIIYFSSLCTFFNPDTRYSRHKIEMESLIRENFSRYAIVRVGNIDWGTNKHQLVPFIKDKLQKNEPFEVYNEYRHLVDKDEFLYWVNLIPKDRNCEICIPGTRLKVAEIVERYKK